ncbi:MAG TPA: hypothetical protein VIY08_16565 [Candidatus Nitrosocosmicus sp.]
MEINKVEDSISKVIESEGWTVHDVENNSDSIRKQIILNNRENLELMIEKNHERITIRKTINISKEFGNRISGELKSRFTYEFKDFLLSMNIYIQVYSEPDVPDLIQSMYYIVYILMNFLKINFII